MTGLLNWLCTAFLKVFGVARESTVTGSEEYGPVFEPGLVGSVDQSEEDTNWRGTPGE
jgi:hypothetical protein